MDIKSVDALEDDKTSKWDTDNKVIYLCKNEDSNLAFKNALIELSKINIYDNTKEIDNEKAKCVAFMLCKKYGIDVSDNENPTLWLTIREEAEHIFFEIRDNGAGMTQEKADQILTYQSSGYGVRNVCDRIHVLYGEKGEMKIESTPGKGTRVFIRIPKNTEAKVL